MNNINEINMILSKLGLTEQETQVLFKHFLKKYINEDCYLEVSLSGTNEQIEHNYADLEITVSLNVDGDNLLQDTACASIMVGKY